MGGAMNRPSRSRAAWLAVVVVAVVVAAVLAWAWLPGRGGADTAGPGNTLMTSTTAEIANARTQLDQLTVGARPRSSGYRRSAFGDAWTDTDGNGCNQRDDVLLRDVVKSQPYRVGRQGGCDHDMLAGTWIDPYTGESITLTDAKETSQAEQVQIDHIVPLSVAWRYGADTWTDAERLAFANDLIELVAAGGSSNQSKGGSDASQWQPVRGAQCGYAVRYIAVKSAYALPTDTTEKRALQDMLATCP